MNKRTKQQLLLRQMDEHLASLEQSLDSLRYSEGKCAVVGVKEIYSKEEFEHFEAFTARFARTIDILTQKVLRSLFMLLGEDITTFLDAANFAEKLELVEKAESLMSLRSLRNDIAHEYATETLHEIFTEALALLPELYITIERTKSYADKHRLKVV